MWHGMLNHSIQEFYWQWSKLDESQSKCKYTKINRIRCLFDLSSRMERIKKSVREVKNVTTEVTIRTEGKQSKKQADIEALWGCWRSFWFWVIEMNWTQRM